MKKETLLTTAIVALLLLNFGTLGFLFFRPAPHPPGPGKHRLDRQIVERLQFNSAQQQTFKKLKTTHHEQMLASDKQYRSALESYFNLLKNEPVQPAQQDSLLEVLTQIQKDRASITFQHFQDLKALCSPEQAEHFSELVPELMRVILPGPERRRRD